ncbi:FecR family protein [Sphingomonas sp. MMS24-J13]|uniref:FecR family protein n=1 Tax=Sphingomonas sp. MMS24-J13 TaxID=3238686 RepID=UPI003850EE10
MSARSDIDERMLDQAIAWQQALAHDDADWDGYLAWLEADPAHAQAFDEIALLDRVVDERADDLRPLIAPAPVPVRRERRPWLYGSIAAAIAVAAAVPVLWQQPDTVYITTTGQTRHLALGGGTAVDLAPGTKLIALGGDPAKLRLAQGEAYFAVEHDPNRKLSIQAGDYAVSDIGTKFGVNLAQEMVSVAVSEGNLSVTPGGGTPTRVSAGQQLMAGGADHATRVSTVAVRDVGSWRQGRLVYDNMPLTMVAADLARYSGKSVTVDRAIKDRLFSGVLTIGDGSRLFENVSDLMGVSYEADGHGVRLIPARAR